MHNKRMQEKLRNGDTLDVRKIGEPLPDGTFLLREFVDDVDYCDAQTESWIWSIGRFPDGRVIASTDGCFYSGGKPNQDGSECVWLR